MIQRTTLSFRLYPAGGWQADAIIVRLVTHVHAPEPQPEVCVSQEHGCCFLLWATCDQIHMAFHFIGSSRL